MIDWHATAAILAALGEEGEAVAARGDKLRADLPRFQNTDYPVVPAPLLVAGERLAGHARRLESYVALLERVLAIYRRDHDVRAYIGLEPAEEALAMIEPGLPSEVRICRVDGYLTLPDGAVKVLENNADSPAGTLFSPRLNRLVDALTAPAFEAVGRQVVPLPFDEGEAALKQFMDDYRAWGGRAETPRLAVLQERGRSNVESREMAARYTTLGVPTVVADPRDVVFTDTGAEVGGQPVHVCWNKINTVYWKRLAAESPTLLETWRAAIEARKILHINPFSSRYVAESKRVLALLHEERFAGLFTDDERRLVADLLPWARKLEPGKTVSFEGENVDLKRLVLERQQDFVLKEPYDIRGDGVTIGRTVDHSTWAAKIEKGFRQGNIVQQYIAPMTYPVLGDAARMDCVPMKISFDSFVFGGRFVGLGSKASHNERVNLFQGGRKLAVRVSRRA